MVAVVHRFTAKFFVSKIAGLVLLQPARGELPARLFRFNVCTVAIRSSLPLNKEGTSSGGRQRASQLIEERNKCCHLVTFCTEFLQTQAGVLPNGSQTCWGGVGTGADANGRVPGVLRAAMGLCRARSEDPLSRSQLLLLGKP